MLHIHQEGMEVFITQVMRLSGESRIFSQSGTKMSTEKNGGATIFVFCCDQGVALW